MEEKMNSRNHKVTVINRGVVQMTGITEVISFDPNEVILETEDGLLLLHGEELHVNHLTLEKGEVHVDGRIESLIYSDRQKPPKTREKGFAKWFRSP